MPRNRTKGNRPESSASEVESTTNTSSTPNTSSTGGTTRMAPTVLTPEQILKIQSQTRTKGAGEQVLQGFLERGNAGEVVDLTTGPLQGKSADSAAATLNNAKRRTRKEGNTLVEVNPQFANILVKKVGKGDEAQVVLINQNVQATEGEEG